MRIVRRLFGDNSQLHVLVVLLFVLLAVFNMATGGRMVTTSNAQNLVTGNAYVLILAVGMVLVIVIGQIDLSVGSVAAFVSMTAALAMYNLGLPWWVGCLLYTSDAADEEDSGSPSGASRPSSPPWRA